MSNRCKEPGSENNKGSSSLHVEIVRTKVVHAFGLVMIKPHAVHTVLDALIVAALLGEVRYPLAKPVCDFVDHVHDLILCGRFYRDLSAVPYGRALLRVLYGNLINQRRFSIIEECYCGPTVFLLIGHPRSQEELNDLLQNVKGNAATYDAHNRQLASPRGIRGALSVPFQRYDLEATRPMDDNQYRVMSLPAIQNFIHIPDSSMETASALKHILNSHDVMVLEAQGFALSDFLENPIC